MSDLVCTVADAAWTIAMVSYCKSMVACLLPVLGFRTCILATNINKSSCNSMQEMSDRISRYSRIGGEEIDQVHRDVLKMSSKRGASIQYYRAPDGIEVDAAIAYAGLSGPPGPGANLVHLRAGTIFQW